jgi:hypothetical protein
MRQNNFFSLKTTYDLYVYDQETGGLRYRLADGLPGEIVTPVGHDVYGNDLVTIEGVEVPIYNVVEILKALDLEKLREYPDQEWVYYTDDDIPSHARMKELFDYDAERGVLLHKLPRQGVKVGTVAGSMPLSPDRPMLITLERFQTFVHRAVYLWHTGLFPDDDVRHRDGDKTNNRIENLYASPRRDTMRSRPTPENSWSGVKGVQLDSRHKTRCWKAVIKLDKQIQLGNYEEKTDAVKARWHAECRYNWPGCRTTSPAFLYLKEHDPAYLDQHC